VLTKNKRVKKVNMNFFIMKILNIYLEFNLLVNKLLTILNKCTFFNGINYFCYIININIYTNLISPFNA
jgi:hypothetical protein